MAGLFLFNSQKTRTLGSTQTKRRYDLPLREDAGTRYLMVLIGLMTFLTALALTASFALNAMSARWSTGLENKMTIEVPATDQNNAPLSREEMAATMKKIAATLVSHPSVSTIDILSDDDVTKLVEPWLGKDALTRDMPLPGLASMTMTQSDPHTIDVIQDKLKTLAPQARLDTHKDWMEDLLRFTGTLRNLAFLVIGVIGLTMLAAVAGGVRARMEVHKEEIKLLHLMGAPDSYISAQFQKHALILAFKGALAGTVLTALTLFVMGWITGQMNMGLLPEFKTSTGQKIMLTALPFFIALLSALTARKTVENVLNDLP